MTVTFRSPQFVALIMTTFGFFTIVGILLFHEVPSGNQAILNVMVGAVGTVWTQQMVYFFGSTQSNKEKDKMVADALAATPGQQEIGDMNVKADSVTVQK